MFPCSNLSNLLYQETHDFILLLYLTNFERLSFDKMMDNLFGSLLFSFEKDTSNPININLLREIGGDILVGTLGCERKKEGGTRPGYPECGMCFDILKTRSNYLGWRFLSNWPTLPLLHSYVVN